MRITTRQSQQWSGTSLQRSLLQRKLVAAIFGGKAVWRKCFASQYSTAFVDITPSLRHYDVMSSSCCIRQRLTGLQIYLVLRHSSHVRRDQWRRYTRARQVKWPGWKIHRPGSSPAETCVLLFFGISVNRKLKCYHMRATTEKRSSTSFWGKKVHPGDLAGGFADLEMTWLLYCANAATARDGKQPTRHKFRARCFAAWCAARVQSVSN